LGTSSAGWGKDCSIIVDQTLEEIVKNENDKENDFMLERFVLPQKKRSIIQTILNKGK